MAILVRYLTLIAMAALSVAQNYSVPTTWRVRLPLLTFFLVLIAITLWQKPKPVVFTPDVRKLAQAAVNATLLKLNTNTAQFEGSYI